MDPSLRHWGLAESFLDLKTGYLDTPRLTIIEPEDPKGKQVRQNSKDLHLAESLAVAALSAARQAKAVFVEVPVGSQSARAMASYGVCVGILGAIRAEGIPLIEVTPLEVKLAFTGNKTATKDEMIQTALGLYPDANFPHHRGKLTAKAEHVADAIAAIHAGVNTPTFQQILRIYKQANP
jgi:Holliday junction resolvasome RuvABC endonuclease subunit